MTRAVRRVPEGSRTTRYSTRKNCFCWVGPAVMMGIIAGGGLGKRVRSIGPDIDSSLPAL